MKKEEVIGKAACGVSISKRSVYWISLAEKFIGRKGVITNKEGNYFVIQFTELSLCYPIKSLEEALKLAETSTSTPEVFPEKWCLKITKDNKAMLGKWRSSGELSDSSVNGYVMYEGYTFKDSKGYFDWNKPKSCTEITTEQFKEHVLKETSESVVEPKVEVLTKSKLVLGQYYTYTGKGWGYKYIFIHGGDSSLKTGKNPAFYYPDTCKQLDLFLEHATPEEKQWLDACIAKGEFVSKDEALKSIVKKWSVGSYVVFCQDIWQYKIGDIDIITCRPSINKVMTLKGDGAVAIDREEKGTFKWFATKEEAEAFAKTLTKAEEKVELVVGKWYFVDDYGTTYKVKYNNNWKTCDYITSSNSYFGSGAFENPTNIKPLTDLSEIQQYLPDGHVDKVSSKASSQPEFVVGQWYKSNTWIEGCYAKFERTTGDRFYFTEAIRSNKYQERYKDWWSRGKMELVSLETISEFLPDTHPDKVVVKEEFKVGDWIVGKTTSDNIADKIVKLETNKFIIEHKGQPYTYDNPITRIYRKALPHEIPTSTTETTKTMTNEELLAYAKEHYPVGTEFNNTNLYPSHLISDAVVSKNDHEWCGSIIQVSCKNDIRTLYKEGKWAEITTPVVSSLSTTIAVKHWGPDLIGKQFVSEITNLDSSRCQKEIPYTIIRVLDKQLSFKLNDHCSYNISKPSFLKHCKLVPTSGLSIPTIQETKSTVNYTVSTALTELSVNIPYGRKTKQVPVITIELSQINCNL